MVVVNPPELSTEHTSVTGSSDALPYKASSNLNTTYPSTLNPLLVEKLHTTFTSLNAFIQAHDSCNNSELSRTSAALNTKHRELTALQLRYKNSKRKFESHSALVIDSIVTKTRTEVGFSSIDHCMSNTLRQHHANMVDAQQKLDKLQDEYKHAQLEFNCLEAKHAAKQHAIELKSDIEAILATQDKL